MKNSDMLGIGAAMAQVPSNRYQEVTTQYKGGVVLAIPTALLRRFYVENSLKNKDGGFEFRLANRIAPTTIVALGPIEIDGEIFAPDQIMVTASKARPASAIHEKAPFYLRMGKRMTLSIPGERLEPGKHQVVLHAITKEVGSVSIEFEETVS
jgi:hypothetical protein